MFSSTHNIKTEKTEIHLHWDAAAGKMEVTDDITRLEASTIMIYNTNYPFINK